MNQKQNNKFVLGRLYPEYFKPIQQVKKEQQQQQASRIHKSIQQRKIQTKLKSIIYNLQRQIQEQVVMNKPKYYRNLESGGSINSKGSLRSFSQKQLGNKGKIHRYNTELDPTEQSQYTQRSIIQKKLKRSNQQNRQSEVLILPKLKLHNNSNSVIKEPQRKQLQTKKKKKKLQKLDEKQQQLGEIVLKKVEEHFEKEKSGGTNNYYERVKSEEGIDQSLLQYLKNKIKKADVVLDS